MKRFYLAALICALLLSGCGAAPAPETAETAAPAVTTEEAAAPETLPQAGEVVTGTYDLQEENAVDDSFTFRWVSEPDEKNIQRYVSEDLLPEYLDTWFEDGEILENNTAWTLADGVMGWVVIGGTPREDLGWNGTERDGKTVYCRNILVQHIPHSQEYQFLKTTPSPDLYTPEPMEELDHDFFGIEDQGLQLPEIKSAELYVNAQCYRLEDPESLTMLRKGLSLPPQVRMQTFLAGLEPEGVGDILVLDLEGQGKRMVLTEPEGGPGCDIWSGHLLLMPRSLYELFGVPQPSKGYGPPEADGRSLSIERVQEWVPYPMRYEYRLDARGNLQSFRDLTESPEDLPQRPLIDTYSYDEEDRLLSHGVDLGDRTSRDTYTYNEEGLLVDEISREGEEYQEHRHYVYDEEGRILSRVHLDARGEEIPGSGVYFWYDDQGGRHGFWYLENGEPGGDPPETPLRRPK